MAPDCVGGAAKGALVNGEAAAGGNAPAEGGAPTEGAGAAPLTGGNGELLAVCPGSGAGNAPCAKPAPASSKTIAMVSGAIRRRIIKPVPSTSSRQKSDSR